ncbi:MAG: polysaccharide biosynthesis C-terminal domain-containing protein [Ginsengibacter sp.]
MINSPQPNYRSVLIQKSVYLFLGRALPVVILFLITIIYSRKLSYEAYGTFQSVWMYANIINVVISFGLSAVILSTNLDFLFAFIKKQQQKIVPFYMLISIAALACFYYFSKNFNAVEKYLVITFIIFQNVITAAESLMVKQGGEKKSFVINFFYSMLFFGWHLYVLSAGYRLVNLIEGACVVSVLKLVATVIYTKKNSVAAVEKDDKKFLGHWAHLGLNDILGVLARWIDKIFLLYLLTSADFAIFFNGSFEIPLFGLLISVTGSLLLIEISSDLQSKHKITGLYRENFRMLSAIVFPLFFLLFFFREEIFSIAFKGKYNASIPIFVISIFVLPIRINNYSVILQCFAQGKKILVGSIMDLALAILLMIVLYPSMGSRGIALAIVVATWCQVLYYLWHSKKLLQVPLSELIPFKKLLMRFLVLLATYLLLSLLLQNLSALISLSLAAIFTMVVVITGMWHYIKSFFIKDHGKNPEAKY